jgi:hypothetical protein
MEIDGQSRSFEVMAISRPDGLGDIANLGLTLAESKLLLAQVQRQLVAEQGEMASCVKVGTSPAQCPIHPDQVRHREFFRY